MMKKINHDNNLNKSINASENLDHSEELINLDDYYAFTVSDIEKEGYKNSSQNEDVNKIFPIQINKSEENLSKIDSCFKGVTNDKDLPENLLDIQNLNKKSKDYENNIYPNKNLKNLYNKKFHKNFEEDFFHKKKINDLSQKGENLTYHSKNEKINTIYGEVKNVKFFSDLDNQENFPQKKLNFQEDFNEMNNDYQEENESIIHDSSMKNNKKSKIKTVFSILSEEIFENIVKYKDIKINTYDRMINELELQKINNKMDKDLKKVSANFVSRNMVDAKLREYKKRLNVSEKTELNKSNNPITRPQSGLSYNLKIGYPSNSTNTTYNISNMKKTLKNFDKFHNENNIRENVIRSPEKFFSDQMKWEETKQAILAQERVKSIEKSNINLKNKPEINEKSKYFVKIRNNEISINSNSKNSVNLLKSFQYKSLNKSVDIHTKLNKVKIHNFKNNKEAEYKNIYSSEINKKTLPEKNIKELIEKLYKEKDKKEKLRSFSESSYDEDPESLKGYNSNPEKIISNKQIQISDESNIVLLKKFVEKMYHTIKEKKLIKTSFELAQEQSGGKSSKYTMLSLYDEQKDKTKISLNFEEFERILYFTGFLKYEHKDCENLDTFTRSIGNLETLKNMRKKQQKINLKEKKSDNCTEMKNKNNEQRLLKDAWKILISQNSDSHETKLDLNIMIIFLLAVLGIYRGNHTDERRKIYKNSETVNNELLKFKGNVKSIDLNTITQNNLDKSNLLSENEMRTNSENINKLINFKNGNSGNNKDLLGVTFAKSSSKNNFLTKKNSKNKLNKIENNFKLEKNLNQEIKNKKFKENFQKDLNDNIYLITIINEVKRFFPEFDNLNFVYTSYITHQIRVIFREFYENWADIDFSRKKSERFNSIEKKIKKDNQLIFKPKISDNSKTFAMEYRSKEDNCYNVINYTNKSSNSHIITNNKYNMTSYLSATSENFEENLMKDEKGLKNINNSYNIGKFKRPKVEEMYDKLNIKKEKELENLRAIKLKKEMKECTFSPNLSQRSCTILNSPKLNSHEISQKLYVDARIKTESKNKLIREKNTIDESYKIYPYSPKLHELDKKMFEKSPIKEDISIKIGYERYEKSRIDKKLKDILTKTGSNINTIKNIENCLDQEKKDEKMPRFRFDNEANNLKNTLGSKYKVKEIDKIKKSNGKNIQSKIFTISNKNSNLNQISEITQKMINMDIHVSKNHKINFEFFTNQDPVILTERFCLQNEIYDITCFKKKDIFNQIREELNKHISKIL